MCKCYRSNICVTVDMVHLLLLIVLENTLLLLLQMLSLYLPWNPFIFVVMKYRSFLLSNILNAFKYLDSKLTCLMIST